MQKCLCGQEFSSIEDLRDHIDNPPPPVVHGDTVRFMCPTDEQQCDYPQCLLSSKTGYFWEECFRRHQKVLEWEHDEPNG